MKDEKFKVILNTRKLLFLIDKSLNNVPNREKALIDRIKNVSYDLLECIYLANNLDAKYHKNNRLFYEHKSLAKLNILDFLVEELYAKKYISEKQNKNIVSYLVTINKLIKGWINFEENDN